MMHQNREVHKSVWYKVLGIVDTVKFLFLRTSFLGYLICCPYGSSRTREQIFRSKIEQRNLSLLVDPVELAVLVLLELLRLEPEGNLLLGVLDAVGAVADVAANILYKSKSHAQTVTGHGRGSVLQWRSHHGWCQGRRQEGWWHRGWLTIILAVGLQGL